MRKCHAQTFRGEDSCDNEPKNKCELEIGDSVPRDDVHNEGTELFIFGKETGASEICRPRHDRNASKWLQDYDVDNSG